MFENFNINWLNEHKYFNYFLYHLQEESSKYLIDFTSFQGVTGCVEDPLQWRTPARKYIMHPNFLCSS